MSRVSTRLLAGTAAATLLSLGAVAPALAAPSPGCKPEKGKPAYPPGQCKKAAISDSTPDQSQSVTVYSGEGVFTPNSVVTIVMDGTGAVLGTATTDSAGAGTFTFNVPANQTDAHSAVFKGDFFGSAASVALKYKVNSVLSGQGGGQGSGQGSGSGSGNGTISGNSGGGVAGLPLTGFELGVVSLVGAGLLGAGTLTVAAGRKRKTAATA